jgi:hypothetical protein
MFFNGNLIFVDENYLLLAMSASLNTYYFYWDSFGNALNSLLCVAIGVIVIIAPFIIYFLFSRQNSV